MILPWEKWCSITCDIYHDLTKEAMSHYVCFILFLETSHRLPLQSEGEDWIRIWCVGGSHHRLCLPHSVLCLTSLVQPNVHEICPYWWVHTLFILFHRVVFIFYEQTTIFYFATEGCLGCFYFFIMNIAVINILIHVSRGPSAFVSLGLYLRVFSFFPPVI